MDIRQYHAEVFGKEKQMENKQEVERQVEEVRNWARDIIGACECVYQDSPHPCPEGEGLDSSNTCDYCKAAKILNDPRIAIVADDQSLPEPQFHPPEGVLIKFIQDLKQANWVKVKLKEVSNAR